MSEDPPPREAQPAMPERADAPPPKTVRVVGITVPLIVAVVVAGLWFTDHLDGPLSNLAPGLTHACVNANSSFE